jgi:hypothetical protein
LLSRSFKGLHLTQWVPSNNMTDTMFPSMYPSHYLRENIWIPEAWKHLPNFHSIKEIVCWLESCGLPLGTITKGPG